MVKWLFPRQILIPVAGIAMLAAVATASAQEYSTRDYSEGYSNFEITPFYGYVAGGEFEDPLDGSDRDLDEGNNFGVILNAAVDEWRHYELVYSTQSTELGGSTLSGTAPMDVDVQYLQFGGTVSNPDAERVIPYFGLTVGAARFSPDQSGFDDETKLAFSIAGGLKVPITEHIGLRFDARAFVSLLDTDGNIFCVSDSLGGACRIRTKSDTLLQYSAALGVTVGF